jgi:hypothetical protein
MPPLGWDPDREGTDPWLLGVRGAVDRGYVDRCMVAAGEQLAAMGEW